MSLTSYLIRNKAKESNQNTFFQVDMEPNLLKEWISTVAVTATMYTINGNLQAKYSEMTLQTGRLSNGYPSKPNSLSTEPMTSCCYEV